MDKEFTKQLGAWLQAENKNVLEGAELLLRLTGNQVQYAAIHLNPAKYAATVEYQLQRHYNFRVAALTMDQLKEMGAKAAEGAKALGIDATPESATEEGARFAGYGKRPDHDELPADIQQLYVDNLEVRRKMQQLHLRIRTTIDTVTNCTASDVYAFVVELLKYENIYNSNWEAYDTATPVKK